MPDVAIRPQSYEERSNISAPLLAHCDRVASIYAHAARVGKTLPPFCAIAPPELSIEDLAFVEWASRLGFREGLETR